MKPDFEHLSGGDKELAAAIAEAHSNLEKFRGIVDENNRHVFPPYGVPMVKVCLDNAESGRYDHVWLEGVTFTDSDVSGTIVEDQGDIPGLAAGSDCKVSISDITDWMYFEGESMHGGFVERILMKRSGIEN